MAWNKELFRNNWLSISGIPIIIGLNLKIDWPMKTSVILIDIDGSIGKHWPKMLYNNVPQCVAVPASVNVWTLASAEGPVFVRDWHFSDFAHFCHNLLSEMTFYQHVLTMLLFYAHLLSPIPKTSNSIPWLWRDLCVNMNVYKCIYLNSQIYLFIFVTNSSH